MPPADVRNQPRNILKRFHPLIASWFAERVGAPTDVQLRAWKEVSEGRHVLVTAPTGSGKTLAAFLWGINQLVTGAWPRGETRVLYISPLKALNNDVRKNLLTPLQELESVFRRAGESFPLLSVQTRSGDTPGSDRQRMLRKPPEILITTPESLNILLTSASGRHALVGISTVILDEIHAVAGTKRGTHLVTAVDRLVLLCGEFQRIALSATVTPLETVADLVGGFIRRGDSYEKRPVTLVRGEQAKEFRIEIRSPQEELSEQDEAFWPRLARDFAKLIAEHRSTLFFANSRRTTERLTRLINEAVGEEVAYAHHGSLSKEIRLAVEEKLKRGDLKAIVATNSLELGIDIGRLDSVVLIQTPRTISSAIQRIGRSGHGVGEISRGLLYPSHGMDYLDAAVMAAAIAERDLEPLHPVEAPLDLLCQIILSMALPEEWDLDELFLFLKTSYPYRNLQRKHFDLVIGMLEGRYVDAHVPELRPRVTVDRLANTVRTREGIASLIYLEGGTIPDRGYFDLRLQDGGAKIGELDEEFVWERRIGDTFSLGAQVWQIRQITHNSVDVAPARNPQQIIPFWRAEELDRDFHFSERIALFLEECNAALKGDLPAELMGRYAMERGAAEALTSFLKRQQEATGTDLPHRHHILVEHFHDPAAGGDAQQAIIHTLWGNAVNRPFTFALAAAWEKEFGYPLQVFYDNDAIALLLPHDFQISYLFTLVTPENVESLLRVSLERTGFFGARFRENAGRALLLPKLGFKKRMPLWLNRLRSKKLLGAVSRYRDFPIVLETWRSCLQDDFDLASLKSLLAQIQEGEVVVGETRTSAASPFAEGLIWQQVNKYVYEDDTPQSPGSALGQDLIRELALSPHLRPRLPAQLIAGFEEKRQRLAPGYVPESARDLVDWVKERLLLPAPEWSRLLAAMARDHGAASDGIVAEAAGRIVQIRPPGSAVPLMAALELLPEIVKGMGRERDEVAVSPILPQGDEDDERGRAAVHEIFRRFEVRRDSAEEGEEDEQGVRLLAQWLSFYGPMPLPRMRETLGVGEELLRRALGALEEDGAIVADLLTEGATEPEICDAANLESLLRILRRSRQPAFEALPLEMLPLFLASFQGVTEPGRTLDDLRGSIEQLFGLPLAVSAWEEEVLPARMVNYSTAWLDSLMHTSDLAWVGCGDRKLAFSFPEDLLLFKDEQEGERTAEQTILSRLIPDPKGRYSLQAIESFSGLTSAAATRELWRLAWQGEVSNDSFVTVRKGIQTRFAEPAAVDTGQRRPLARRWKRGERTAGNWYLIEREPVPSDPLEREELNRERVRLLLDRYGILFRELLQRELPPLQWSRLFRTLRIMELSGEVLCGSFFLGIPGLQFISHEAFRQLSKGVREESIYWLNAGDPASLCGIGLDGLKEELPPRIPGTHLVYHGSRLVVVSRRFGKEIQVRVEPEHPRLVEYLSLFAILVSREFNPRLEVSVERVNGAAVQDSPYREALFAAGFEESYKGVELRRKY
ncbi:DEAD/DEAH box helicase [Geomonas sp. RF6]|uniref:DEAD/DEAH box helicase n=1 Tax=Geomonas sp. RF6 TaxID=2897342 RepID=UPI001E413767|nr:DEAD/DEAH box helicase [Geomonas sp. RF6]UFS70986.1 DEAD/DEAH box helicase [Geomonas sp. RF6]